MKAALLALILSFSTFALPVEQSSLNVEEYPLEGLTKAPTRKEVMVMCEKPDGLITAARALLKRYFETNMYNSTLFDQFLWLHPEHEDFITCVICRSGRPNDPYWETDFVRMCIDRGESIMLVEEDTQAPTDSIIL